MKITNYGWSIRLDGLGTVARKREPL